MILGMGPRLSVQIGSMHNAKKKTTLLDTNGQKKRENTGHITLHINGKKMLLAL